MSKIISTFKSIFLVLVIVYIIADTVSRVHYTSKIDSLHKSVIFYYESKNFNMAETLANRLLEYSNDKKSSFFFSLRFHIKHWNFGNAVHTAHTVLGLLALQKNNVETAKKHLIQSALISGSPQLDSFGPSMLLAKQLLSLSEREVVIEYLNFCSEFWDTKRLQSWRSSIKRGSMPYFRTKNMRFL